jgi:adenosylcobinamide hydrolase
MCRLGAARQSFNAPRLACSSAIVGGGLLELNRVVNVTVSTEYLHPNPVEHAGSIARELGLAGEGACLLTAVDVEVHARYAAEDDVIVMIAKSHPAWTSKFCPKICVHRYWIGLHR